MAMFHLDTRVGQRSKGQSVAAKLAYNGGCRLDDRRLGKTFDYSRKAAVVASETIAPDGAPDWVHDRQELARRIEEAERNKDGGWREKAVLWREIEVSFPRGLSLAQRQEIVRERCSEYVGMGMVAVVDYHSPTASDGGSNDHAHLVLTQRPLDAGTDSGFSRKKDRAWDALFNDGTKEALKAERGRWADAINAGLTRACIEDRVDHRSYADQGVHLIPTSKIGVAGTAIERRGGTSARAESNRRVEAINKRISAALGEAEAELKDLKQREEKAMAYRDRRNSHRDRMKEALSGRLDLPESALDDVRYVDAKSPRRVRIRLKDGEWVGVERDRVTVSPRSEATDRFLPHVLKASGLKQGHVVEQGQRTESGFGRTAGLAAKGGGIGMDLAKARAKKGDFLGTAAGLGVAAVGATAGVTVGLTWQAVQALADLWKSRGYHDVAAQKDGVHIWLPGGTRLHDQGHHMTIHGPVSDEAISALTEKAKRDWDGGLELTGNWSQKDRERVWLECQRQGVELSGFTPSQELQARWDRERESAAREAERHTSAKAKASTLADRAEAVIAYASGRTEGNDVDPAIRRYVDSLPPADRGRLAASDAPDVMLRMREMRESGQDMPEQEKKSGRTSEAKGPRFGMGGDDE